jgi:hypothetical protein
VSGISEFGLSDSKSNFKKVEMLISAAHEVLPGPGETRGWEADRRRPIISR